MYYNMKLHTQLLSNSCLFTCKVTDMVGAILEGYPKSKKQFLVSHSLKLFLAEKPLRSDTFT